ncbi:toll/interleukin-1 receptor domain-containing protein [Streptomyces griseoviridis]|uniref:toll/interleukin-1 receptor domain-containing protein n=1 Tax=Streptomyces griseoviridis TaxID=45398 RepID=UPI0034248C87
MDSQHDVRIDLTLADEGGRRMDSAPNGVSIGAVRLRGWQTDRIDAPAGMFDGYDAYFVKINYEVELDPQIPSMPWLEITFDFISGGEENLVSVVDALPRFGTFADTPKPYVLNQFLNFVPSADGASAHVLLPASRERVDTFGIGGQGVRWRHVSLGGSGVQPGSHAAWLVLLVPAGQADQRVEFSARYDVEIGPDAGYQPTQSPAEFKLTFSTPSDPPGVVTPSLSAGVTITDRGEEYHPSVFICYAHDTFQHKDYARQFGNLLVRNGVDAHMDQWYVTHRKDWAIWARELINRVDFVAVLASPICKMAFDGELKGTENPGIRSESLIIKEKLHAERDEWTPKVLPVVLPHELVEHVPEVLQPWTSDHYNVGRLTPDGIDDLLRAMTGAAAHVRPPLGKLPPSVFKPLSGTES